MQGAEGIPGAFLFIGIRRSNSCMADRYLGIAASYVSSSELLALHRMRLLSTECVCRTVSARLAARQDEARHCVRLTLADLETQLKVYAPPFHRVEVKVQTTYCQRAMAKHHDPRLRGNTDLYGAAAWEIFMLA